MDITLKINLKAVKENYRLIKSRADLSICASVVKANAYGLGIEKIALALKEEGCNYFFVANLDEALQLRKILPKAWIAFFHGISQKSEAKICYKKKLIPVINNLESLDLVDDIPYILHIDTGMNRLGIAFNEISKISVNNNLQYLMTHPACADVASHPLNQIQFDRFENATSLFPNVKKSYANSFALFSDKKYHFDMVRPGCSLYGINPLASGENNPMSNVVFLNAKILQTRYIDSDTVVGYGAEGRVKQGSTLATIAFGYADGCIRSIGNKGFCAINGVRVPIIGRVSMDLIVIDITNCGGNVMVGDEVEIIGNNITVDDFANFAGTIGYEVITRLGSRLVRVY